MTSGTDGTPARREGIPLGRIAGVPIILAYSWFLIAGFIVLVFGPQLVRNFPGLGMGGYGIALAYALLLLISVLVHELAHALTARLFHWPTAKIVLTLWGGHTQFGNFNATPGRSLIVALAGPAANFVLAGIGFLLAQFFEPFSVGGLLSDIFLWANVLVAVFNVLPGLPLDGGRIVESAVWRATGSQEKGTVAAGWSGRVIVVLLVLFVVLWPLSRGVQPDLQTVLITVLVSGFLWMGATAAIDNARMRLRLPLVSAGRLMRPAIGIPAGTTVAQARTMVGEDAARTGVPAVILVAPTGHPEAVVDFAAMAAVPEPREAETPVNAVARALPAGGYVPEDAAGQELVQYLARLSGTEYAVTDKTGRVTGLLDQATVVAAITGRKENR